MSLETWLYAKECLGKDGMPIRTYKVRTMDADAEERLDEILSRGLDSYGHIIDDPRVTPVGRLLRKYAFLEPLLKDITEKYPDKMIVLFGSLTSPLEHSPQ